MPSPSPSGPTEPLRAPGFGALLPAVALAGLAYRDLFAFDARRLGADGLLEWFTRPNGLWFPLVLAGAASLAWRRREAFAALPLVSGCALGAVAFSACAAAMLWSRLTDVTDPLVWSCSFAALAAASWRRGAAGARTLALPILFLLFALSPPPRLVGEALWWIQSESARAATALIQALGAPVLVEGIVLSTPDEVFGIVESCAALGILMVLTAAALLLRERVADVGRRSWLLVLLAPIVALAINLGRITSIVLHPPLNQIHHLGQWAILFALGSTLLLGVLALLARARPAASTTRAKRVSLSLRPGPPAIAGLAALAALSFVPPPASTWRSPSPSPPPISTEHAGWRSQDVPVDRIFLGLVQFRQTVARHYTRDAETVNLFVGVAPRRHPGASPFSAKTILMGMRWVPLAIETNTRLPVLPRPPDQSALMAREGERWWVAQWRFGDPGVFRESLRQLFALDASPFSTPPTRRVVRIAAPLDPARPDEIGPAQAAVASFAHDFEAELFGGDR